MMRRTDRQIGFAWGTGPGCSAPMTVQPGASVHLARLGLISAYAQAVPTPNYKALVCIFLFGGNDGNDTIIPPSAGGYSAQTSRWPRKRCGR